MFPEAAIQIDRPGQTGGLQGGHAPSDRSTGSWPLPSWSDHGPAALVSVAYLQFRRYHVHSGLRRWTFSRGQISLCHLNFRMPHHILHCSKIDAMLKRPCGERGAEFVEVPFFTFI